MSRNLLAHHFRGQPGRPVLLFLHGFLGCGEDWTAMAGHFESEYALLTVDLPGHGGSHQLADSDPSPYSMAGCAAQLGHLLDRYEIETCHAVGYSMGSRLALYLAVNHADRFDHVVIESGSPGLKTEAEREERRRRDAELARDLTSGPLDNFLDRWYNQPLFATLDQTGESFRLMRERRLTNTPEGLALSLEHMGTGAQPSLWEALSSVLSRVLFIAGEKDRKFYRLAAEMAHLCPHGELAIIAGAGHNVHVEQPELYRAQVVPFLAAK